MVQRVVLLATSTPPSNSNSLHARVEAWAGRAAPGHRVGQVDSLVVRGIAKPSQALRQDQTRKRRSARLG